MTHVHFANNFNSTFFTDCCGVAVGLEENCPKCGEEIEEETMEERSRIANNRPVTDSGYRPHRGNDE